MQIQDIIARRTDLSTFLVHLTRDAPRSRARDNLLRILLTSMLEARTPYGAAVGTLVRQGLPTDSQKVVCFTETPLEHVHLLAESIEGRAYQFAPYGVGITKVQGRRAGVNPVWYLDMTPGHDWLTENVDALVDDAIAAAPPFDDCDIAGLTPYIEHMGTWKNRPSKEFWWEREWRHCGSMSLPSPCFVFAPEDEHRAIAAELERQRRGSSSGRLFLDPNWSLEQMIARLAGFSDSEIGPFPLPQ